MNLGNYSKLIGALVGNIVGIVLIYLASRGVAECTVVDGTEVCEIFGFSAAQITGAVMMLLNSLAVYFFPPNRPT